MVDESKDGLAPQSGPRPEKTGEEKGTGAERPKAPNRVVRGASGTSGGRRNRLRVHVLLGFLMAGIALAGYAFLGPSVSAKSGSGRHLAGIATNVPAVQPGGLGSAPALKSVPTRTPVAPYVYGSQSSVDLSAMQAEMDDIARRVAALKAEPGQGVAAAGAVPATSDYDKALQTLESLMSTLNQMMSELDSGAGRSSTLRAVPGPALKPGAGGGMVVPGPMAGMGAMGSR